MALSHSSAGSARQLTSDRGGPTMRKLQPALAASMSVLVGLSALMSVAEARGGGGFGGGFGGPGFI